MKEMIKKMFSTVLLIVGLTSFTYSQGIVEMMKTTKVVCNKSGKGCKVKSSYKRKRDSNFKLAIKKKSKTPYTYVYASRTTPVSKVSEKPLGQTSPPTAIAVSQPQVSESNAQPVASNNSNKIAMNASLKNMSPQERKKEVLNMPPSRTLEPIRFISAQDEFSVVNMDSFMEALELVKEGKMLLVEGHTDDVGSDNYNLQLSMKRVEKIRQLLLSAGASDDLISVIGYGEKQPLVPNTTDTNREVNRRIEFKIFDLN